MRKAYQSFVCSKRKVSAAIAASRNVLSKVNEQRRWSSLIPTADSVNSISVPINQPTALTFNNGALSTIDVGWTAATDGPTGYLLVRVLSYGTLNTTPIDGIAYIAGQALGNGTVLYRGAATSVNVSSISDGRYYVFSYNQLVLDIVYKPDNPLNGLFPFPINESNDGIAAYPNFLNDSHDISESCDGVAQYPSDLREYFNISESSEE